MRRRRSWRGISGVILLFAAGPAAAECLVKSGPQRVALLELFTSEGCSSCPPAERWLAELGPTGLAPARVAPLALHVDYWDSLGWKDPFAQARFTERQYAYRVRRGAHQVYTPQFVLDGTEYRGWFRGENFSRRLESLATQPPTASLAFSLTQVDRDTLEVTGDIAVTETVTREPIGVYVALYENNLVNDVRAGENRGRQLRHHYVVRRLEGPFALSAGGRLPLRQRFALAPDWKRADLGVTAFVQNRTSGEVLQTAMLSPCLK